MLTLNPRMIDLTLERIVQVLQVLGNPHLSAPPVVHIAGTNGKGSVAAYLRAILKAAGYRVHAFVSPHFHEVNERIVINHEHISDADLLRHLKTVEEKRQDIPITFFEFLTCAAFLAYAETEADLLILETGLGGRLDASNVIPNPLLSLITSIGLDHQAFLGNDIKQIAREKAHIMKRDADAISVRQTKAAQEVLLQFAKDTGCRLQIAPQDWDYHSTAGLDGSAGGIIISYGNSSKTSKFVRGILEIESKQDNAALAAFAAKHLAQSGFEKIDSATINQGLKEAVNRGRLEPFYPAGLPANWQAFVDSAHNPHAAKRLAEWLAQQARPLHLVLGMGKAKDHEGFLSCFGNHIDRIDITPIDEQDNNHEKARAIYASREKYNCACHLHSGWEDAIKASNLAAEQHAQGTLLVCGSIYLAAAVTCEQELPLGAVGV